MANALTDFFSPDDRNPLVRAVGAVQQEFVPAIYGAGNDIRNRLKMALTQPKQFIAEREQDANTHLDKLRALTYQEMKTRNPQQAAQLFPTLAQSDPEFVGQQAAEGQQQMQDAAFNGLTVWHGSPHKFDKFDMSKIGTGEGSQAYGHGLYLAENPSVAQSYADSLSKTHTISSDEFNRAIAARDRYAVRSSADSPADLADAINGGDTMGLTPRQAKAFLMRQDQYGDAWLKGQQDRKYLYKVDLPDEAIAKMLDWDKPLSQQPEVLRALEASDQFGKQSIGWRGAPDGMWEKNMSRRTGEDIYRDLTGMGWTQRQASEYLKNIGITGNKYLDGGSRSSAAGTRNFVSFDDKLPKILEVNGGLLGSR